ncbi:putative 26S protease regulatory subunit [Lentithecium fluviatile CBS 122367]|uniref:Putative 26S protease regulatory subunit n=1 Tax=Lentithecium fluviatile CBS 122367 TaxID=1168545 RepID=A0A6G1IUA6_9PLEO|nr:putative 26S protease regulatory subunit [Lentithecium fluviatile CBS 122367]
MQHAPNISMYAPMGDIVISDEDDECGCSSSTDNVALCESQRRDFDRRSVSKPFERDGQYLLCPPQFLGYRLDTRNWLELSVTSVQEIAELASNAAFDKLRLDPDQKNLIRSLVNSHTSSTKKKSLAEDIVKGKGKASSFFCMALLESAKLLRLRVWLPSQADRNVERNLESLFELAARWRAVLLFDEADVFLESRGNNTSDLNRNALVSVLLRVLEYYQGIMILINNRIKLFDVAVQFHVNLGLMYKELEFDDKRAIFEQFIHSVDKDKVEDREAIMKWFSRGEGKEWFEHLNGRQVRNVLFSAASLGSLGHSGDILKLEHIKTMAKATFKFQDSLRMIVEKKKIRSQARRCDE